MSSKPVNIAADKPKKLDNASSVPLAMSPISFSPKRNISPWKKILGCVILKSPCVLAISKHTCVRECPHQFKVLPSGLDPTLENIHHSCQNKWKPPSFHCATTPASSWMEASLQIRIWSILLGLLEWFLPLGPAWPSRKITKQWTYVIASIILFVHLQEFLLLFLFCIIMIQIYTKVIYSARILAFPDDDTSGAAVARANGNGMFYRSPCSFSQTWGGKTDENGKGLGKMEGRPSCSNKGGSKETMWAKGQSGWACRFAQGYVAKEDRHQHQRKGQEQDFDNVCGAASQGQGPRKLRKNQTQSIFYVILLSTGFKVAESLDARLNKGWLDQTTVSSACSPESRHSINHYPGWKTIHSSRHYPKTHQPAMEKVTLTAGAGLFWASRTTGWMQCRKKRIPPCQDQFPSFWQLKGFEVFFVYPVPWSLTRMEWAHARTNRALCFTNWLGFFLFQISSMWKINRFRWWRSLGETNDWHQRCEKKLRFGFQLCLFNGARLMRFCVRN